MSHGRRRRSRGNLSRATTEVRRVCIQTRGRRAADNSRLQGSGAASRVSTPAMRSWCERDNLLRLKRPTESPVSSLSWDWIACPLPANLDKATKKPLKKDSRILNCAHANALHAMHHFPTLEQQYKINNDKDNSSINIHNNY